MDVTIDKGQFATGMKNINSAKSFPKVIFYRRYKESALYRKFIMILSSALELVLLR